ncbi:unnamed protein product, partial [Candidula unifasciata]
MAEHAAHSMLDLSETGSLEHLAGGGHTPQTLSDLNASGRVPGQSVDSAASNGVRRQQHSEDRMSVLSDGSASMRQMSSDRDMMGGGSSNTNGNGLVSRPLSVLGGGSLPDRQNQPVRNLTPVGLDGRGGQHGGLGASMNSDGRGSVGLGNQNLSSGGGSGNGMQESRNSASQSLGYSPAQSSNLMNSVPIIPRRGRPPTLSSAHQHLGSVDQHRGGQSLPLHMRGLSDHQGHSHQSLVEHHSQQQNLGGDNNSNNHNGRNGISAFGMDNNNGQLHSRPGSTLLSEASNHNDARDLTRPIYSTPSISGDRGNPQVTSSLIEETIAAVASNFNKSSPDGGIMPGPLPPNSLMGLGVLGLARSNSTMSHLGHGGDDSLADLVGRHHTHSIPLLSERASHSLSGLMDEHSINHSINHAMNHAQGHGGGQVRELEKTHPCLTCLKMFRSKQQLAQHSLVHTGIRKHICSFCDRAFKQLSHLQQHVRIHTGERKYVCQICNRAFKQMTHLQQHHIIHTGERKYVCQVCSRAFKQMTHLQQHLRIHTGERKYICQICNRAFKQLTHLQKHHVIHTGERKYVCQICNHAFKQLTHLQQHHKIHTGERKYICQCCDRAFKQLTHLQQHYRIHT